MFKHHRAYAAIAAMVVGLVFAGTALSAAGTPPPSKQKPAKQTSTSTTSNGNTATSPGGASFPGTGTTSGQKPAPQTCSAHLPSGLVIQTWLDKRVADGQPAHFKVTITNRSCESLNYGSLALFWNFDNNPLTSASKSIQWASNGAYAFNDGTTRSWLVLDPIAPGKNFTLKGTITVPDRAKTAGGATAATMYIVAAVKDIYPMNPNRNWGILGDRAFGYYADR